MKKKTIKATVSAVSIATAFAGIGFKSKKCIRKR